MSIALVRRGCMLLLTTPNAVLLSVCMGVFGCLCPISCRRLRIGTASHALMYNAPNSASAALDMTPFMIFDMLRIAPLLGGSSVSPVKKKCPPALLLACGSLNYDASLCTASTMSLFSYVNMASGCVAT